MTLVRQIVLECKTDGHNKFYEISLNQTSSGKYSVNCRWGRIEQFKNGNTQKQCKGKRDIVGSANGIIATIQASKMKKGYKLKFDKEYLNNTGGVQEGMPVGVSSSSPFDRTEHVEKNYSNWWDSVDETIEERVV